jgi:outer membrane biosynthesis protein TonB
MTAGPREPRLGTMMSVSLGLHVVLVLLFSGFLMPKFRDPRPPTYMVDLVHLPVKDPQAGRPDGTPKELVKPEPEPKPKPKPVVAPKPKPAPVPAPVPKPKPKAQPKPVAVKPAKPKPKPVPQKSYQDTESVIDKLRRERERDALKQKLAAMGTSDTRATKTTKAPLGEMTGTGKESGVGFRTWLQQAYKNAWSLSKYQVSRSDLETEVEVVYDARGFLRDYTIKSASGDRRFDDSVTQAIRTVDRLEPPPEREIRELIKFNLKDLLE